MDATVGDDYYKDLANRTNSFRGYWPSDSPLSHGELANAGLYYTGPGDRVQCAWCKGGLYNWEEGDIPVSEHKKHFPKCSFIQRKIEEMIGNEVQQEEVEANPLGRWEDSAAVKIVGQMGYDDETIEKAMRKILSDSCRELTACKLLDAIYKIEEETVQNTASEEHNTLNEVPSNSGACNFPDRGNNDSLNNAIVSHQQGCDENTTKSFAQPNGDIAFEMESTVQWNRKENKAYSITDPLEQCGDQYQKTNKMSDSPTKEQHKPENITSVESEIKIDNLPLNISPERQREICALQEENKKLKLSKTCKICLDNEVNVLFLPCRHIVCCEECGDAVKTCPLCRTGIVATVKTYLA